VFPIEQPRTAGRHAGAPGPRTPRTFTAREFEASSADMFVIELTYKPYGVDQEARREGGVIDALPTAPAPADREIEDGVLRLVERPHRVPASHQGNGHEKVAFARFTDVRIRHALPER
jgi:hypothetical protein